MNTKSIIIKFRRLLLILLIVVMLVLFLFTTNPAKLPIALLMTPLGLFFLGLFLTFQLLLSRFLPKIKASRRNLYAVYAAGLPSFLLVMSSVNQLTWRDFTIVLFLVLCLFFYTSRANFGKNQ